MKIAVVGTGYVGLVAGTCFAESGNDVVCIDIDRAKVEACRRARSHLRAGARGARQPQRARRAAVVHDRLSRKGSRAPQVVFIAVGTPPGEDGSGRPEVRARRRALDRRPPDGYTVVVDKSTVPVGTAAKVRDAIRGARRIEFDVVSNPEFLKEGAAIDDFLKPDRVVIGATARARAELMDELYAPFVRTGNPILQMDIASAELTKYAANAMLATRISFMNEIANICDARRRQHRRGAQGHRLGRAHRLAFLFAGVGYGGTCFPKDVQAIVRTPASTATTSRS